MRSGKVKTRRQPVSDFTVASPTPSFPGSDGATAPWRVNRKRSIDLGAGGTIGVDASQIARPVNRSWPSEFNMDVVRRGLPSRHQRTQLRSKGRGARLTELPRHHRQAHRALRRGRNAVLPPAHACSKCCQLRGAPGVSRPRRRGTSVPVMEETLVGT